MVGPGTYWVHTVHLRYPTPGLGTETYPIADGVTATICESGVTVLIGVAGATYNADPRQHEALLNPYALLDAGADICLKPHKYGGSQSILLGNESIPLDYHDSRW